MREEAVLTKKRLVFSAKVKKGIVGGVIAVIAIAIVLGWYFTLWPGAAKPKVYESYYGWTFGWPDVPPCCFDYKFTYYSSMKVGETYPFLLDMIYSGSPLILENIYVKLWVEGGGYASVVQSMEYLVEEILEPGKTCSFRLEFTPLVDEEVLRYHGFEKKNVEAARLELEMLILNPAYFNPAYFPENLTCPVCSATFRSKAELIEHYRQCPVSELDYAARVGLGMQWKVPEPPYVTVDGIG